jgi:hypothetical protein
MSEAQDSRRRFRDYMAGKPVDRPPRFESQIPEETIDAWRNQGLPQGVSPNEYFGLDERDRVPIPTSGADIDVKPVAGMRSAGQAAKRYFSNVLHQYPPGWPEIREAIQAADKVIYADIYPRGFLQEMGVKDSATLTEVLLGLCDEPRAAELVMEKYTDFLVEVIHTRYRGLDIEYFLYSEPIASPKAPVISPQMYRRFVLPWLTTLGHEGRSIGVREHVLSTRGGVKPLIPGWIEAGISGLWIGHAAAAGIDYLELRREYGSHLGLWGGVDNRVLYQGENAIAMEVDRLSPLFSSGRYIAMVDDTIRPQVRFAAYAHYRRLLDEVNR